MNSKFWILAGKLVMGDIGWFRMTSEAEMHDAIVIYKQNGQTEMTIDKEGDNARHAYKHVDAVTKKPKT
nr:hypothetical protein [Tanacetum cinerariifolium]